MGLAGNPDASLSRTSSGWQVPLQEPYRRFIYIYIYVYIPYRIIEAL